MPNEKILGVLGGTYFPLEKLARWGQGADFIIAADSGYDRCVEAGITPHVIVGDFDSCATSSFPDETRVIREEGQDDTDCGKLLRFADSQGFSRVYLTSTEGDLMDHQLDAIHTAAKSRLETRFALNRGVAFIIKSGCMLELPVTQGSRVSLIPITEVEGASLEGVRWQFQSQTMSPLGFTSNSNEASGSVVRATVGSGVGYLFIESDEISWN
jgi:thiamine pyrophosphokinase